MASFGKCPVSSQCPAWGITVCAINMLAPCAGIRVGLRSIQMRSCLVQCWVKGVGGVLLNRWRRLRHQGWVVARAEPSEGEPDEVVPEVVEVGGAVAPKPPRQRARAEAAKDHPAKRIDRYVTTKQPLLYSVVEDGAQHREELSQWAVVVVGDKAPALANTAW